MATPKQRREVKKRMAEIKQAKDEGASKEELKRKSDELLKYLYREGILY